MISKDYEQMVDRAFGQLSFAEKQAMDKFRDAIYSLVKSMTDEIEEMQTRVTQLENLLNGVSLYKSGKAGEGQPEAG